MKNEELSPRIRIRSPLRCDGIGRLDCAEDTESGARLAVRWLPLDANGDAAVRACAKLPEHPTLPRVRQTGQVGDKAFVAMEFPDGQLLSTLLGETVGGHRLIQMGAQLADALATVHAQGVVHGEMSAESVLLAKGKAYLWDMPLVIANRLTDRRGEERLMHQLVRTAPFLSPERARGAAPSPEGDVYSLAAVMCLAGGAPMPPAGTTLSVVHAIGNGTWAPVVPALFHETYPSLLARMLEKEPAKRPTAREVADLLGRPTAAVPTIPEMPAVVPPSGAAPVLTTPPLQRSGLPVAAPPTSSATGTGSGPRPAPKTPYAAAPGALEPMLPTRAVADAAVKSAAANHKPLQVSVPTQVESTVRVNVPVGVLVAMSQPIAVDAELKAVVDSLRPVLAAEPIATIPWSMPPPAKTLEFGTAQPAKKEKTPPPAAAPTVAEVKAALKTPTPAAAPTVAAVKAALKTPTPAAAPTVADVKSALKTPHAVPFAAEVKAALKVAPLLPPPPGFAALKLAPRTPPQPAPAPVEVSTDAPAAAITAPNPPPFPRKQSREIPPPPMGALVSAAVSEAAALAAADVPLAPADAVVEVNPSVQVQENVCVSGETFAAGAAVLGDEEADGSSELPRSKPTFLLAAAVLAVLTTALAVGGRALVSHAAAPAPVAVRPVAAPAPTPQPDETKAELEEQEGEEEQEDELAPLPAAAPRPRRYVRKAAPPPPAASKLEGKYDSHGEATGPADDFSFLGTGYEPPKEELKRPAF